MVIALLLAEAQLERLAAQPVYAAEIHAPLYDSSNPEPAIKYWADYYGVSFYEMRETLNCESGFNPHQRGDQGHSWGIAQIYLPAHEEISKKEALNPDWSLQWMAEQFKAGKQSMWTCWRTLFGTRGS